MAETSDTSKTISLDELSKHNNADDLWLAIDGKVYDVTKFKEEHPGGDDVLLEKAGQDATQDFEDVGHSDDAVGMMKDYCVGELEGEKEEQKSPVLNTTNAPDRHSQTLDNSEKVAFCRCWQSQNFPYCDGSHRKVNEETGSNVGPVVVSCACAPSETLKESPPTSEETGESAQSTQAGTTPLELPPESSKPTEASAGGVSDMLYNMLPIVGVVVVAAVAAFYLKKYVGKHSE